MVGVGEDVVEQGVRVGGDMGERRVVGESFGLKLLIELETHTLSRWGISKEKRRGERGQR
jgi:hypothetical protein